MFRKMAYVEGKQAFPISQVTNLSLSSAFDMLRMPRVTMASLQAVFPELAAVDPQILARVEVEGQT